ncbi:hypothetical protein F441_22962 [Phytophthora nicotianae CJ01A1]|uniref:CCHC-type domain-containing protein n=5 Tax=Phytophthora nicotianae TaxID=4792 RepID=W2NY57_PHYNI|nr:hypothetical protein L917_10845 [Phytophthora nicotianae]ETM53506.1 hypothetical protein L914_03022 [Phytophthora nicotianae]ETO72521.1 hypothetical protein F444_11399 [Phytophthora nicotianae P1976]ETO99622.1 hypothetical protein F441_22962 [Phytophthora nicotianae CJ01A1]
MFMAAAHGKKEGKCYNCEKRGHFKSECVVECFLRNEKMEHDGWILFRISDTVDLNMGML